MSDARKTKEQLIQELASLRRKLLKLEQVKKSAKTKPAKQKRPKQRFPRDPITADIEFIGDFDVIKARGVNISEGGMCLRLNDNLPFEFQLYRNGALQRYRAYPVWLKQLPTGEYHFGFKFIDDASLPEF